MLSLFSLQGMYWCSVILVNKSFWADPSLSLMLTACEKWEQDGAMHFNQFAVAYLREEVTLLPVASAVVRSDVDNKLDIIPQRCMTFGIASMKREGRGERQRFPHWCQIKKFSGYNWLVMLQALSADGLAICCFWGALKSRGCPKWQQIRNGCILPAIGEAKQFLLSSSGAVILSCLKWITPKPTVDIIHIQSKLNHCADSRCRIF